MTTTDQPATVAAEVDCVPDGTAYPFVEDLDGNWHMRPPGDEWVVGVVAPNAQGLCGPVYSVHASAYAPDEGEPMCSKCRLQIEAANGFDPAGEARYQDETEQRYDASLY